MVGINVTKCVLLLLDHPFYGSDILRALNVTMKMSCSVLPIGSLAEGWRWLDWQCLNFQLLELSQC